MGFTHTHTRTHRGYMRHDYVMYMGVGIKRREYIMILSNKGECVMIYKTQIRVHYETLKARCLKPKARAYWCDSLTINAGQNASKQAYNVKVGTTPPLSYLNPHIEIQTVSLSEETT